MKFYDKKYFELVSNNVFLDNFNEIPDKKYSDKEIENLYNKVLKIEMENEKKEYNTKPDFLEQEKELEVDDFDINDYIYADKETGELHIPKNKKEAKKIIEEEKKKALKKFNERPPFDEEAFKEEFKENYEFMLKENVEQELPDWVLKEVDNRILALSYLPKSILEKLKKEQMEREKKLKEIREEATKVLDAQHIPSKIKDRFLFYDSVTRAFKLAKNEKDYELRLVTEEDELAIITFKDTKIIENEKMDFRKNAVYFIGEELYLKENKNYEVHMIFTEYSKKGQDLKYITLECSDIKINKS